MAAKTFKTQFLLGAKYTGGPAFGHLNRDIDRTQRNVKQTSSVFGRIFGKAGSIAVAVGGTIAAFEALRKAMDVGKWAFEAAKTQKKAHDIVRQSNQRLAAEGRIATKDIEKRTQETIALAEAMNKAGGLDAETLEAGLAGLNKYLSSKQVKEMSKGWQDWMVKIHKGAPTMDEAVQDVDNLNKYILTGKKAALTSLGLTKEQTNAIEKQIKGQTAGERAQSRAAAVARILSKETGEMARWLDTDAGKAYLAENALEDLGETIGGPMVAAQREMNIALTDLYKALGPVAELIAKEMTPAIQTFTTWLKDNKDNIVKWGEMAVTVVTKVFNGFWWLQAQSESFFKPIYENSVREFNNIVAGATKAWEGVKEIWGLASGWFSALAIKIGEAIAPVYEWIIAPFKKAFEWIIANDPAKGYIPPTTGSGAAGTGGATEGDYVAPWQDKAAVQTSEAEGWGTPMNPKIQKTSGSVSGSGVLGGVLAGKEKAFEEAGAKHGVDPKLLMAIAEFETGHGKSYSARTRNNIAGIMNPRNPNQHMVYKSIEEGIDAQAALLKRGYISQGRTTIPQIGAKYSPPGASNDPNRTNAQWPASVQREYDRISKAKIKPLNLPVPATNATSMQEGMIKDPRRQGINTMRRELDVNQRLQGSTGAQNVAMNSPITINGVPTGKEMAVARAARRAIQDPIRAGLDQMKAMKKAEDRLTYV